MQSKRLLKEDLKRVKLNIVKQRSRSAATSSQAEVGMALFHIKRNSSSRLVLKSLVLKCFSSQLYFEIEAIY